MPEQDDFKTRLQNALNAQVGGNAWLDLPLWKRLNDLFEDAMATLEDRQRILAKINEITGEDDPCDEAAVQEYQDMLAEGRGER